MSSNLDQSEQIVYQRKPVEGNNAHVILFTLLAVALIVGMIYGLLSAIQTGEVFFIALFVGCLLGLYILWWRIHAHDARAFVEEKRIKQPVIRQVEAAQTIWPLVERSNGDQIDAGKYRFTWEQWHALGETLERCGWKWVRDQVRKTRPYVFKADDINLNWKGIVGEFQRIGFVDADQMTTETGKAFFYRFIDPPAPAVNGESDRYIASGGERRNGSGGYHESR